MPPKPKVIAVTSVPAATLRDDSAVARLFAHALLRSHLEVELGDACRRPPSDEEAKRSPAVQHLAG